MTRARRRLLAAGAACLLAAAALGLLARASLLAERDLRELESAALQGSEAAAGSSLGVRVGDALLRTGDDRTFLRAVVRFRAARSAGAGSDTLRADAKARLARLVGSGARREQRAYAGNLYGVLLYEEALVDTAGRARLLELALAVLQEAVVEDPANEAAKTNLELVARAFAEEGGRLGESPGQSGETGAGSSPPGSGF